MISKVSTDLKVNLPDELVDALLNSYEVLKQNFYLGKHEPSELNGGKLVEACVRIIQYETNSGNYTPIGTTIPNMIKTCRDFEAIPKANANESFRIHIPRVLTTIYNIRSQRGVGHLGGDVNPNHSDASLLIACADWIAAELFRIYYQCTLDDAQEIVDNLIQRRLLLVHELEDNKKRVLLPALTYKDQTLLLLASEHPNQVSEQSLVNWIEPSNKTDYRYRVLKILHKARFIEYEESKSCMILPPGLRYVERQYPIWISNLN